MQVGAARPTVRRARALFARGLPRPAAAPNLQRGSARRLPPVRPFDLARMWIPELNPLEVVARSALAYLAVLVVFRIAGRKAFQRWGPPEIVLLFLVSTAMRRSLVVDDPSVTTALIALVTLAALDRLVTTLTARSRRNADRIEGPVLRLVRDGELDRAAMARARLGEHELLARVRARGRDRLDEIRDAWFERSGEVTIVFRS